MAPEETVDWLSCALSAEPRLRVAGVAGPGEPLANDATFKALGLIGRHFPHLLLCLSTNGLLLPQHASRLARLGVDTITVTMNALDSEVAARIYAWVDSREAVGATGPSGVWVGEAAAELLIERQLEGIARVSALGMVVIVNTVLIPGLNDGEIGPVAGAARERGAVIQNIMPLIPLGRFQHLRPPTCEELEAARAVGCLHLPQFRHCRQCRADAVGVPGEGH
jgi:nitrogen fixation protein NifB